MRSIVISGTHLTASVDDDVFDELSRTTWGLYTSWNGRFYARGSTKSGRNGQFMHRVLTCAPRGLQVDHMDGNGLNNVMSNLRLCTAEENQWNKGPTMSNTSGFRGVCRQKGGKWQAQIRIGAGRRLYLGTFDTPEQASASYEAYASRFHGEFAWKGRHGG
jgi:HNH endonuclease/AP2 domain